MLDPGAKLLPAPIVHAGLAPLVALAVANEEGAALRIEICLGQCQCLADPESRSPKHDDKAADSSTMTAIVGLAHHRHDLLNPGWIGRVAQSLVTRRAT